MLTDTEIARYISSSKLIENFKQENLHNSTYTLCVGSVFHPKSGDEEENPVAASGAIKKFWTIGPTECLIIKTKEKLNIPRDICAYYAPLNRLAQRGVMLLNASVVEPGYSGYLSCFLVNFSSSEVEIPKDHEIAKITFHKLDGVITNYKPLNIADDKYGFDLSVSATKFENSFLGLKAIEERAKKAATESVSSSVKWGTIFIGFLLLFAQLEPLISKYLWGNLGVITTTRRIDENNLKTQIDLTEKKLSTINQELKSAEDLSKLQMQMKAMQEKLDKIESEKLARRSRKGNNDR